MSGKSEGSEDFGRSERTLSCSEDREPPWEPNIQMDLGEFDRDSVSYLAEVNMEFGSFFFFFFFADDAVFYFLSVKNRRPLRLEIRFVFVARY